MNGCTVLTNHGIQFTNRARERYAVDYWGDDREAYPSEAISAMPDEKLLACRCTPGTDDNWADVLTPDVC